MRKYVILSFLMLILLVVGCSSKNDKSGVPSNNELEQPLGEELGLSSLKASDVQEVKLSRSLQFGSVSEAMLSVFTEQDDIELFIEAIGTAKKDEGVMDIRRPDYDVILVTKDAVHSIHLWLDTDNDSGTYTQVSDTGTGYSLNEEAVSNLKRLIMSVPYSSVQAEQNGDIVNMHGKLLNLDKWDTFLTSVKAGTMDQVQITSYTIEGDPIFYNLNYDGESIQYTYDTTMDAFGNPQRATAFCEAISTKLTDEGTEYSLAACQDGKADIAQTFWFVVPKS